MLDVKEIFDASMQYQKQHGQFPTKILINPQISKELAKYFVPPSPSSRGLTLTRNDEMLSLDWYVEPSVTGVEKFRLS
jgi:hypothetical protein